MKFYDKTGEVHTYLFMSIFADKCNYLKIMKYIDLKRIAQEECLIITPLYPNKIFDELDEYKKIYNITFRKVILHKIIKTISSKVIIIIK